MFETQGLVPERPKEVITSDTLAVTYFRSLDQLPLFPNLQDTINLGRGKTGGLVYICGSLGTVPQGFQDLKLPRCELDVSCSRATHDSISAMMSATAFSFRLTSPSSVALASLMATDFV